MQPSGHERHNEHFQDKELQGIAERSLRERIPVDELKFREADAERVDELRAGAKAKLLAMAGYTTGKAATESRPVEEVNGTIKELAPEQQNELLKKVKARFEVNMDRHKGLKWAKVQAKLEASPGKMWSLNEMERTGGEPDVVGFDKQTGEYIFMDCSAESPEGRRMLCYDHEGQKLAEKQKGNKPKNVIDMAASMGIEVLTKAEYLELQKLFKFDSNSQSWVKPPADIRNIGRTYVGSRFEIGVRVQLYAVHRASANRGFRGKLKV